MPEAQLGEKGVLKKKEVLSSPNFRDRTAQLTWQSVSDGANMPGPMHSSNIWAVLSHGLRVNPAAEGSHPERSRHLLHPRTRFSLMRVKWGLSTPKSCLVRGVPASGSASLPAPLPACLPTPPPAVKHCAGHFTPFSPPLLFPSHPWSKVLGVVGAPGRAVQPRSPSAGLQGLPWDSQPPTFPPYSQITYVQEKQFTRC